MNIRISWDSDATWFPFFLLFSLSTKHIFYIGKLRLEIRK